MAKTLRTMLTEHGHDISHSAALELVAHQFGYHEWNVLAAHINSAPVEHGIELLRAIPILRMFSEEKAREFYIDYLGFEVDWEHRFEPDMPLYMQIHRSDLIIHLSEHHGDGTPGSTIFLEMSGIEAYHAELTSRNYNYYRPGLEREPWGLCFSVEDGFGNGLRFCER